jgi:hypothetical protein
MMHLQLSIRTARKRDARKAIKRHDESKALRVRGGESIGKDPAIPRSKHVLPGPGGRVYPPGIAWAGFPLAPLGSLPTRPSTPGLDTAGRVDDGYLSRGD